MNNKTKNFYAIKKILKWPLIVLGILLAIKISFTLLSPVVNKTPSYAASSVPSKEKFYISSFSPDSRKLYLEFADVNRNVKIGWMDLLSKQVSLYVPQDTQDRFASPSSSADGRQLVVVIKEAANNFEISQIGVIDLLSNSYRVVTKSNTYKQFPSFSRDGKKIIYGQSNRIRESGKTRFSDWDIYEVEVKTGNERRLTTFCFFGISNPFYFNDGGKFVVSGEPSYCKDAVDTKVMDRAEYRKNYLAKYQENTIFMLDGSEKNLSPILINGPDSRDAYLTHDGKIFFVSRTNEMDGIKCCNYNYDIFVSESGAIKRLTDLKTMLTGMVVSPKGDFAAYISDPLRAGSREYWMMDVKNTTHERINFGNLKSFQLIELNNNLKGTKE